MKLIKDEYLAKLYDLYKNMLSETQKKFMLDFVDNDLTISEIAENNNISRQAVNDAIRKSVAKMKDMEKTLGFLEKLTALEQEINDFKNGRR